MDVGNGRHSHIDATVASGPAARSIRHGETAVARVRAGSRHEAAGVRSAGYGCEQRRHPGGIAAGEGVYAVRGVGGSVYGQGVAHLDRQISRRGEDDVGTRADGDGYLHAQGCPAAGPKRNGEVGRAWVAAGGYSVAAACAEDACDPSVPVGWGTAGDRVAGVSRAGSVHGDGTAGCHRETGGSGESDRRLRVDGDRDSLGSGGPAAAGVGHIKSACAGARARRHRVAAGISSANHRCERRRDAGSSRALQRVGAVVRVIAGIHNQGLPDIDCQVSRSSESNARSRPHRQLNSAIDSSSARRAIRHSESSRALIRPNGHLKAAARTRVRHRGEPAGGEAGRIAARDRIAAVRSIAADINSPSRACGDHHARVHQCRHHHARGRAQGDSGSNPDGNRHLPVRCVPAGRAIRHGKCSRARHASHRSDGEAAAVAGYAVYPSVNACGIAAGNRIVAVCGVIRSVNSQSAVVADRQGIRPYRSGVDDGGSRADPDGEDFAAGVPACGGVSDSESRIALLRLGQRAYRVDGVAAAVAGGASAYRCQLGAVNTSGVSASNRVVPVPRHIIQSVNRASAVDADLQGWVGGGEDDVGVLANSQRNHAYGGGLPA